MKSLALIFLLHVSSDAFVHGLTFGSRKSSIALQHTSAAERASLLTKEVEPGQLKLDLHNAYNAQYYMDIRIGNQDLPAIIDTGSWDLLALSSHCRTCETHAHLYTSATSSTFASGDGTPVTHAFGSGALVARRDFEDVAFGDAGHGDAYRAKRIPFWQVLEQRLLGGADKGDSFSAIVGFGHSRGGDGNGDSDAETTLLEQFKILRFAMCLRRGSEVKSWIALNPPVSRDEYQTVPVVGPGFWAVQLTNVRLGRNSTDPCRPSCAAVVDSGTSLLAAPPEALEAMAPVLSRIALDCGNLEELPDLEFNLGGHTFALSPSDYVLEVDNKVAAIPGLKSKFPRRTCFSAFNAVSKRHSQFGPMWILGIPFLRRYLTVFDRDGPNLHIATATQDCSPAAAARGSAVESSTTKRLSLVGHRRKREVEPAVVNLEKVRMAPWAQTGGSAYMPV
eukprot:TRINITY_DN22852_c0_g1_i1.p1 TRINITY_DN22852_c0_g1~~TRINITY_DN22852_c0_g1_i1.p1  ORF type:complete len:475 (-),score=72.56 TRINITY_DN22852_c0_g1_i1:7-1353(-)